MKKIPAVVAVFFICTTMAFAAGDYNSVRESLIKAFPNAPVDSIKKTPIEGLFEIRSGDNIFYYSPKSENIIIGEIYTKDRRDLTAEARNELIEKKLDSIDLTKAIKVGSGKNVVIEFTDPDCPFCRKSFEFWKSKKDITHYIFLYPVPSLHPKSPEKSEWILSQKNKAAAFDDVLSGKYDKSLPQGITEEGKNLLNEQMKIAATVHVTGTPMFFVNGKFIPGANFQAIDKALEAGPAKKQEK
jgi:thiol:disulfide interchange protein DsbC